jgi:hypothetical protein
MSMSYPTQEDELRAKESGAEELKTAEESRFLSTFQSVPKKNAPRLGQLAGTIVNNFNVVMRNVRQEPYERQEQLMVGLKKLFEEQIRVIEARRVYTLKINPSSARTPEEKTAAD